MRAQFLILVLFRRYCFKQIEFLSKRFKTEICSLFNYLRISYPLRIATLSIYSFSLNKLKFFRWNWKRNADEFFALVFVFLMILKHTDAVNFTDELCFYRVFKLNGDELCLNENRQNKYVCFQIIKRKLFFQKSKDDRPNFPIGKSCVRSKNIAKIIA